MRILIGKTGRGQQADLLAERIQLSYPFHPDLLFNVPPLGSAYQRTRGLYNFWRVRFALSNLGILHC